MPGKSKWTVLTYIAAHNNLDAFGKKSLLEILAVGSARDVVHGALFDSNAGAARYVMGPPGAVERQEKLGKFDSGDPDALIATAKWLFEQFPAQRYGLVLWSHGSGWEPEELEEIAKEARPAAQVDASESTQRSGGAGSPLLFRTTLRTMLSPDKPSERAILFDDGSGHSLDTLELARVAASIANAVGQPLEFVGMDACLMANLEVAYEIRRDVRYLVASEELVPGHSWPYKDIYAALQQNGDQGGADFASLAVDRYASYYDANPPGAGDVTKVALDLGKIDKLTRTVGGLATAIVEDMDRAGDALWKVQHDTRKRETRDGARKPSKFEYDLWDVGSVAAGLAASPVADDVKQRAQQTVKDLAPGTAAVLAERHRGDWFDGIGGATVYLPAGHRVSPWYPKLAFAKDAHWDAMLRAYHEHIA